MFYRLLPVLLLSAGTLLPTSSRAQPNDSLLTAAENEAAPSADRAEAFMRLAWSYRTVDLDSGFAFLGRAAALLPDAYDTLHAERDYVEGMLLGYRGDYPEAISAFGPPLAFYEAHGSPDDLARTRYALGFAHLDDGRYETALRFAQLACTYYQEAGLAVNEIGARTLIASILDGTGRLQESIAMLQKALKRASAHDVDRLIEPIYNNLANAYLEVEQFDTALVYYRRALRINEKRNDLYGIALLQGNIADLYVQQQDYPLARRYLDLAIASLEQLGAQEQLIRLRGQRGAVNIHLGQHGKGLAEAKENLRLAREHGYHDQEGNILLALHRSAYDRKMYQTAARYQQQYIDYIEARHEREIQSKVDELNARFQRAEQDQRIALLNADNEVQRLQLGRQQLLLWGGGGILLVLGALLLTIYRLYWRVKEQHGALATALGEKEVLLKEIHHRVKNNLQVVSSLLNLQSYKITDPAAYEAVQEGRTRVHAMSLIHQALYNEEHLTGVNIRDYLGKLCRSLFDTYRVTGERVTLQTEIDPLVLDVDSVVPLGLVLNELLTNALKHAFPDLRQGTIRIRLVEEGERLRLVVADDGVGLTPGADLVLGDSFGFELIRAFERKLEADLDIESGETGTEVKMLIRNYQKAA